MSDSNSFLYQYDLNDDSVHQEPTPYTSFESLFDSIPQTNDSSTDYSDDKLVNWDLFSFNGTSDLGVASPNLIDLFHDREQTTNSVDPFVSVFSDLTTTGMPEWTKYRGLYTDTEDSEYWTDSVLPLPFTETMPEDSSPNRWRSFSESGPVIRPRRPASAPRVCSNDNCRTTVSASGWRYLQDDLNRTQPFCSPCKLYFDANGQQRPKDLCLRPRMRRRLSQIPQNQRECSACSRTETAVWRFIGSKIHCNSCYLRAKKKLRNNRSNP